MKYLFLPIILLLAACSSGTEELSKLDFPYQKDYQAVYFTKSTLFRNDGSIQTTKSDSLYLKIFRDLSEKGTRTHEWLMLPGLNDKNVPDTMLSQIDSSGLYIYFSPDFLPEGTKEIKLIDLPLKQGAVWESSYLSFPAKATYLKDSTIITPAGEFKTFGIQYEFLPYYMNEFIQEPLKYEVRGVLVDYYSNKAGKVLTQIDFYVTDRKSGKIQWKILSNQSVLNTLILPN